MHSSGNHLINETSPYLLQHAHNPVNWYPWSEEALQRARTENKPILVSIGYAACHWCHVMERESFEDEDVAAIMNNHFINIKVDREERPDLDHIYMDAVQTISGSGGWPLNVFLTPECKPFYGGTYFPPRRSFNRPSWKEILGSVMDAFQTRNQEIRLQAENLTEHIMRSNAFGIPKTEEADEFERGFSPLLMQEIFNSIMKSADAQNGGFGMAPKFPQTFILQFLLHHHYYTKNETALKQACLSLDKMIAGGIYDHLGGGFARYSTDNEWLIPHFEKMLYDSALLIIALSEAYQITKKDLYAETIKQTMGFICREMLSPQKGFYSAIDADSEGEEGRYYVWTKNEVDEVLGPESELFCSYYGISEKGNWENKNILHTAIDLGEYASLRKMNAEELSGQLEDSRKKLFEIRRKRKAPLLDDKIILGWNCLMNIACSKAFAALGVDEYKELGVENMRFLMQHFEQKGLYYFAHCFKNDKTKFPAFLDDYSFLISALIQLQEITADSLYLFKAREITDFVIDHFSEAETGFFFYNHEDQLDIILRKKEVYDGAIPSGNAMMAVNLLYLAIIFDRPEWKKRAISLCISLNRMIVKYPSSFGLWATLIQAITYDIPEVVITGEKLNSVRKEFLSNFIPYKVYQSATQIDEQFPLLKGKPVKKGPLLFLCKGYNCQLPVTETAEFVQILKNVQNFKQ